MADQIAETVGIGEDSPHRIKAGIKFILNQYSNNGHTYMLREHLIQAAYELLGVSEELIENALIELQVYKQIWQEKIEDVEAV